MGFWSFQKPIKGGNPGVFLRTSFNKNRVLENFENHVKS